VRAGSESEITNEYLVSRESYLVKKKEVRSQYSGVRRKQITNLTGRLEDQITGKLVN
jgi:hypothetical protein